MLQDINFFAKINLILEGNETFGIEAVSLPSPMVGARDGELHFILKTNANYNLENRIKFLEKLGVILGKEILISTCKEDGINRVIESGDSMTGVYKSFLQSAVRLENLKENEPLEAQWIQQIERAKSEEFRNQETVNSKTPLPRKTSNLTQFSHGHPSDFTALEKSSKYMLSALQKGTECSKKRSAPKIEEACFVNRKKTAFTPFVK